MKTYWDLSKRERSELTEEQVRDYGKIELMQAGVVEPIELPPAPEPIDSTKFDTITYYGWGDDKPYLVFETKEVALDFLKLNPLVVEHEWLPSCENIHYCEKIISSPKAMTLYDRDVVLQAKPKIREYRELKEAYDRAKREFKEQQSAVDRALSAMWEDYASVRRLGFRYQEILTTSNKYVELAEGDEEIARKFLEKAYSLEEIEAAEEWFGKGKTD